MTGVNDLFVGVGNGIAWPFKKVKEFWNWGTGKVKGEPQPQMAIKDDLKEIEEYSKTL